MKEEQIELEFKLSIEETNLILTSLSKQPFEVVVNLIDKLKSEAQKQLQPEPIKE